uniref:Uncharacterized protein n=1 Tax=Bracon brevicornis TaxID=1563983 RepID=A0A6V7LGJ3_9HYME
MVRLANAHSHFLFPFDLAIYKIVLLINEFPFYSIYEEQVVAFETILRWDDSLRLVWVEAFAKLLLKCLPTLRVQEHTGALTLLV